MNNFYSSPDLEEHQDPLEEPEHTAPEDISPKHAVKQIHERLLESPIQILPIDLQASCPPPALIVDIFSQEEPSMSPFFFPELIEAPDPKPYNTPPMSIAQAQPPVVVAAPPWSDASLRTYLEDDTEISDLLVVVHNKSGVVPAGPDHPTLSLVGC
ncbi:hypothetical protein MMC16_007222 [Acarospora aff. strigata]|nr:hypothetical protein [Acarospora aff. strigata]